MRQYSRRPSAVAFAALFVGLVACDESLAPPTPPEAGTITVDASAAYAPVRLVEEELVATIVGDRSTSTDWDLAFFSTTVSSNGGAAGPGGVEVACVCENQAASDADV